MEWLGNVEPSLDDALSDPLILSVIATSDRSPDDVRRLVASLAQSVRAQSPEETQTKIDRVHPNGPDGRSTPPGAPHAAKPLDAPTSTSAIPVACSGSPSLSLPRKVLRLLRGALSHR
jgi:hypothetical protein